MLYSATFNSGYRTWGPREGGGDRFRAACGRGRGIGPQAIGRSASVTEEMGPMCRMSFGRTGLLAAAILALVPSWALAQPGYLGYAPHDESQLVTPLGSTRPEEGGFFVAGSYIM